MRKGANKIEGITPKLEKAKVTVINFGMINLQ